MNRLVVTADDVGLTDGVNAAVEQAHRDGVVTAASVLAVGRSFDGAAEMVRRNPGLSVGAHLAIVGEDPPLLSAREVPTLVDRRGQFPLSYRTVVLRAASGRLDPADIEREFAAQLQRIRDIGVDITHLDTHQHTHLWPSVGAVVAQLANTHGIGWVRTPTSAAHGPVGVLVRRLSARLRTRLDAAGVQTSATYAGLDEAGDLTADRFAAAVARATRQGGGSVEVNTHPGVRDDGELARFDWDYHWPEELEMLIAPATRAFIAAAGYELTGFADLGHDR